MLALDLIKNNNSGRDIEFHLNPGMFYQRATTHKGEICPFKKIPSPEELEKKGDKVINSDEARLLLDNFFLPQWRNSPRD